MSSPPIQPTPHPKLVIIRRKTTVETIEEVPVVMDCDKRAGFIYEIYNDVNDMVYVGSTINMEKRMSSHKTASLTETSKFYLAVREIGFDNFHMRCLEEFRYNEDAELVKREFEHIAEYEKESLYNTETVYGVRSDEVRAKISASNLGKTHTNEVRAKISASHLGMIHTDETKVKMSKAKQNGGGISVKDNYLHYRYYKDGRRRSKCFSFGSRSHITQEQAMILALAYQRETFPDLFDTDEE